MEKSHLANEKLRRLPGCGVAYLEVPLQGSLKWLATEVYSYELLLRSAKHLTKCREHPSML
jgi:hypothetical protein